MGVTKQASIGTYGIWKVIALDSDGAKSGAWKQGYRCNGAEFAITEEDVDEMYDGIFAIDQYMTAVRIECTINDARFSMPDTSDTASLPTGDFNVFQDLWSIDSATGITNSAGANGLAESTTADSTSGKVDVYAIGSALAMPYLGAYYRCYIGAPSGSTRRIFEMELCKIRASQFTIGFTKTETTKMAIPLRCLLNSYVTTGGNTAGTLMLMKKSYNSIALPSGG